MCFFGILHCGGSTTRNGSRLQQAHTHIYQIKKMTFQVGKRFITSRGKGFPSHPNQLLGPPSLLFNAYQGHFPLVKWARHECDHFYSPISSPEHQNTSKINIICCCGQHSTLVLHLTARTWTEHIWQQSATALTVYGPQEDCSTSGLTICALQLTLLFVWLNQGWPRICSIHAEGKNHIHYFCQTTTREKATWQIYALMEWKYITMTLKKK